MTGFNQVTRDIELAQLALYATIVLVSLLVWLITTRVALVPVRDSLVAQKRFIESVAHELRTSLSILKTQTEVAKMDPAVVSLVGDTLNENIKEIDHITEILNNLLVFNRVGTLENIVFDTVNMEVVIETVISRLQRLAEYKGVAVVFEKSTIPLVYGNSAGLEQALFNLIKNGIIYAQKGGTVTIQCLSVTEYNVTLRISDDGIGIAKDELPHIFKLFYRTDSVQGTTTGTGLGLALVLEIIKLHGGKISVESTPGVGTQFDVTIPRRQSGVTTNRQIHEGGMTHDFSTQKV